ncbi:MAG: zinc ribbon domain-containing protein [Clostridiales bacterium]|jgi:hypothetical protein|nr:zinc ribbon domain-containing protein [Clostridiales bacterium]
MEDKLKNLLRTIKATAVATGQAAGRVAGKTGKKAGEVWDQTKMSLRIVDLEGEIKDHYREIGRIVYTSRDDTTIETSTIEEHIAEIDRIMEEIEKLREKIDDLKPTKKCPNPDCGKRCDKDDRFCASCGAVLE